MMFVLLALSAATATPPSSPAVRFEAGQTSTFTATVTIRRAVGVGRDMAPPPWAHAARKATVDDAAGQPHPALIYDFE